MDAGFARLAHHGGGTPRYRQPDVLALLKAATESYDIILWELACARNAVIYPYTSGVATRGYAVTPAVVEQRRQAGTVHGATSERRIQPVAKNQKRKLLRQLGVRAGDLDAIAGVMVDLLARSLSKLQLLDTYYIQHGIVRVDGEPEPSLNAYLALLNTSRLTASKLAEHMASQGRRGPTLEDYIDAQYGDRNGDEDAS